MHDNKLHGIVVDYKFGTSNWMGNWKCLIANHQAQKPPQIH